MELFVFHLASHLHKFPHEIREMPLSDVLKFAKYFEEMNNPHKKDPIGDKELMAKLGAISV